MTHESRLLQMQGKGYEDVKEGLKKWKICGGYLGMELDILPTYLYLKISEMLSEFLINSHISVSGSAA